jgi:hypothetical protein
MPFRSCFFTADVITVIRAASALRSTSLAKKLVAGGFSSLYANYDNHVRTTYVLHARCYVIYIIEADTNGIVGAAPLRIYNCNCLTLGDRSLLLSPDANVCSDLFLDRFLDDGLA